MSETTVLTAWIENQIEKLNRLAAASASQAGTDGPFYIVDLRTEWSRKPYITVWRPDDAGYAYPLPWAGRYEKTKVDQGGSYYHSKLGTQEWKRFPVACVIVDALAVDKPKPGIIDGDAGPVLPNTAEIRAALRRARYAPDSEAGGKAGASIEPLMRLSSAP